MLTTRRQARWRSTATGRKQQLSEEDYMKAFAEADEHYSQILTALLAQAKK